MNKLLVTLGLIASTTLVHAQGTINPLNGALTRLKWDSNGNGVIDLNDNSGVRWYSITSDSPPVFTCWSWPSTE